MKQVGDSLVFSIGYKYVNDFKANSKGEVTLELYIKKLFHDYIQARNKNKNISDKYIVNQELARRFRDDFYKVIVDMCGNISKMIDLDNILNDINGEDTNSDVIVEIKTIVVDVLRRVIRDKITALVVNKLKINDISGLILKIKPYSLSDIEISKVVSEAIRSTGSHIESIRKEFGNALNTYKLNLINVFKEEIVQNAANRKFLERKMKYDKTNMMMEKFNPIKIIDRAAIERASKLCDSIFLLIDHSFGERSLLMLKNFCGFLIGVPKKILSAVTNSIKSFARGVFSKTLFVVTNLVLKPLCIVLEKSFNIISGLTKLIYSIIKFIFLKTKVHFLLLSPPGMYALGFLIGFVWEKLKLRIPDLTFSIAGLIKFCDYICLIFSEFYKTIKDCVTDFLDKHPKLHNMVYNIHDGLKYFANNVKKDGLFNAINLTEMYLTGLNIIESIKESWMFKFVKNVSELLITAYLFMYKHPILSGILWGTAYTYGLVNTLTKILKFIPLPITKTIIKGGIIPLLLTGALTFGTLNAVSGIMNFFGGDVDIKNSTWKYGKSSDNLYNVIGSDYNRHVFEGLTDKNLIKKYELASQYVLNGADELLDLDSDLRTIETMSKHMNDESFNKITNGDVFTVVPNLVSRITMRIGADSESRKKLEEARRKHDSKNLVLALRNMLTERSESLIAILNMLNSANEDNVKFVLDSIIDNNGTINLQSGSLASFISSLDKTFLDKTFVDKGNFGISGTMHKGLLGEMFKKLSDNEKSVARASFVYLARKEGLYDDRDFLTSYRNWNFARIDGDTELNIDLMKYMLSTDGQQFNTRLLLLVQNGKYKNLKIAELVRYANLNQVKNLWELAKLTNDSGAVDEKTLEEMEKLIEEIRCNVLYQNKLVINESINTLIKITNELIDKFNEKQIDILNMIGDLRVANYDVLLFSTRLYDIGLNAPKEKIDESQYLISME